MGFFFTDWIKKNFNNQGDSATQCKDYKECLKILNQILDEEATTEQYEYFKNHIKACLPCYEMYHVDKAIKQLIKTKCNDKKVPSGLVDQIKLKISETSQP